MKEGYKRFVEENLSLVDKTGTNVPFIFNDVQKHYFDNDASERDIILKARQQGFSSLTLALFTTDFLLKENSSSVVVADIADNATGLLDRVKYYIKSYEQKHSIEVPLKYNSKYELYNTALNTRFSIGTAENTEFGRSKTITNLLLSEAAFYLHFRKLLAGALQAVVPNGRAVIETTANGFNDFKDFWYESKQGATGFTPLFYKASDFYTKEFLDKKRQELGRMFKQEYPDTDIEAFLTSGRQYFDSEALQRYLERIEAGIVIAPDVATIDSKEVIPRKMQFFHNPNFRQDQNENEKLSTGLVTDDYYKGEPIEF